MLTVCRNGSNWYLLQCKPRQDERAQLNLQQQNYSTFRPQLMSERSIRGKRQRTLESLFPGYVFIQLSRDDNWAPIRSTRGVSRIVEFNHVPARVDEDVIAQLRERSQESPQPVPRLGEQHARYGRHDVVDVEPDRVRAEHFRQHVQSDVLAVRRKGQRMGEFRSAAPFD